MEKIPPITCWGIELSEAQTKELSDILNLPVTFKNWSLSKLPELKDIQEDSPFLLIVSLEAEKKFWEDDVFFQNLKSLPRVLFLNSMYSIEEINAALDLGASAIIRPPLKKESVNSIIFAAYEIHSIHHNFFLMTREILFERELLLRKNEILDFLVKFLSKVVNTSDSKSILETTFDCFHSLIGASSMHVALWSEGEMNTKKLSLYINDKQNSDNYKKWENVLTVEAYAQSGVDQSFSAINKYSLSLKNAEPSTPDNGEFITFFITKNGNKHGMLLLPLPSPKSLGRDLAEAINLTLNYLGIALTSTHKFFNISQDFELDALTGMHNRKHFEEYLPKEIKKLEQKGDNQLFLMVIDIDKLKEVNDKYGYLVGDSVLKDVSSIITDAVSPSAYCARYAGERFCVLLPEDSYERVLTMAENIREAISTHKFLHKENFFQVTVSIGVSVYSKRFGKDGKIFFNNASLQLDIAKKSGKDCIKYDSIEAAACLG